MVSSVDFGVWTPILISAYVSSDELVPARLLRHAVSVWGELYNPDPVSLPLPSGIPSEVPSVILTSRDGRRRLEVARSRINVVMYRTATQDTLDIDSVLPELANHLNALLDREGVSIGRLAVVVSRTTEMESPGMTIARHYFQERWLEAPLNQPQELEIHTHKVFDLQPGLPVNSWVRIKTAKRVENDVPVIAFEQDLNTLEEERASRRFSAKEIAGFYLTAASELAVILDLYFPAPDQSEED